MAIIDNSYTPYIFQYGRIKYVPIEVVAAVVECKSTRVLSREADDDKNKEEGLAAWCSSIRILRTSRESIARMATGTMIKGMADRGTEKTFLTSTQTSTKPIRIFCGYKTEMSPRVKETIEDFFDFILVAGSIHTIQIRTMYMTLYLEWICGYANANGGILYIGMDDYGRVKGIRDSKPGD